MHDLSQGEVITLNGLLKMEKDGLAAARAIQPLVTDDNLKKRNTSISVGTRRLKTLLLLHSVNSSIFLN